MPSAEIDPKLERALTIHDGEGMDHVICTCRGSLQEVMNCHLVSEIAGQDTVKSGGFPMSASFPKNTTRLQNKCSREGLHVLNAMLK